MFAHFIVTPEIEDHTHVDHKYWSRHSVLKEEMYKAAPPVLNWFDGMDRLITGVYKSEPEQENMMVILIYDAENQEEIRHNL